MSQRTLFEVNHDLTHKIEAEKTVFVELLGRYLRSGSPTDAEDLERFGIRFFGRRHHGDAFNIEFGGRKFAEPFTR